MTSMTAVSSEARNWFSWADQYQRKQLWKVVVSVSCQTIIQSNVICVNKHNGKIPNKFSQRRHFGLLFLKQLLYLVQIYTSARTRTDSVQLISVKPGWNPTPHLFYCHKWEASLKAALLTYESQMSTLAKHILVRQLWQNWIVEYDSDFALCFSHSCELLCSAKPADATWGET